MSLTSPYPQPFALAAPLSGAAPLSRSPLELWGGVECTFNRVGEDYFSQLKWNGHLERPSDLDAFADLGIRALRYPVIWEMLAPRHPDSVAWNWPDQRLNRLRELGIRPIAGLVHHGSGPRYAPIQTPEFAPGLAYFAGQVARRYPWLEDYTPVNEPLTTARFCGLYGHWHPHGDSNEVFVRILLNECRATALAMFAVREVNSAARLVQTDDLGRIYATPGLAYQADFENLRRWLSFDLLSGRVHPGHELWGYLLASGATMGELDWFCAHPCPPDVIGINHYPTSDRFLDENLGDYPPETHGGNGREAYADVEALRVLADPPGGFKARLWEAWERYNLPLAVTEAHLGCTREEQLRWTAQAWQDAQQLRDAGADVRAVTAWSLLGAWNWNSLVTRDAGFYEPGIFDARAATLRPTALAQLLRDLVARGHSAHPAAPALGWWQRDARLLYEPRQACNPENEAPTLSPTTPMRAAPVRATRSRAARPLLILGASGTLGSDFARACRMRGLAHFAPTRAALNLGDAGAIEGTLRELDPWAVINAAGYVRVDDAEDDDATCFDINTCVPELWAQCCAQKSVALACFSSDLVFDGRKNAPYLESDAPAPLSVYGRSKAEMERRVLRAHPGALVARTSAFFGVCDEWNFVTLALRALANGEEFLAADDAIVSPTFVPDLVRVTLDLLVDGAAGLWHLANEGALSWADLGRAAARRFDLDEAKIIGVPQHELPHRAPRPRFGALASENGRLLPDIEEALDNYQAWLRVPVGAN